MATRGCDGHHRYCHHPPVCTALGQTQPQGERNGMGRTSPTAVILAGPFCLQASPFPTRFCPEAMTWLKALNFRFCPTQQSWGDTPHPDCAV